MSNRLEHFVNEHREEFDDTEPSPLAWDRIQEKMGLAKIPQTPVHSLHWRRWVAVAALLITLAGAAWVYLQRPLQNGPKDSRKASVTRPLLPTIQSPEKAVLSTVQPSNAEDSAPTRISKQDGSSTDAATDTREEMYHYAKLVEIKERQLKIIEKDEPLLYHQFSADVKKLDSVYHTLKNQLTINQNSEELLEAMIENLQLQMGLLNHQLSIIKKINHTKKTAYEKAYQSI